MSTHPIDIVIPWVDGSDPVWQADHAKYRASKSADNHPARYREWGLFRYWFRGIEQNAPWVRKVHLLTYGHLPAWLEPDHPKLHIVNHRDFIPEEYLPTFSSHTIELNMHRIPDLAEHFLYFNDDVYLMKPSRPEDFFRDGLPCDTAVMGVIKNNDTANFMPYIMLNMMALVNMSFDKRSVIRQNFGKWFYPATERACCITCTSSRGGTSQASAITTPASPSARARWRRCGTGSRRCWTPLAATSSGTGRT